MSMAWKPDPWDEIRCRCSLWWDDNGAILIVTIIIFLPRIFAEVINMLSYYPR